VEKNKLRTKKSDQTYEIEGITDEKIFSNEFAHVIIRLRRKGAQVFRVKALVLPRGHWTVPLPKIRPGWLCDLNPYLAHSQITDESVNSLNYQVILGGAIIRTNYGSKPFILMNCLD
jgi:hypothetical protein